MRTQVKSALLFGFVFVVSFMAEVSFAERPIIIYHRGGEGERGFCG